MRPPGSFRIPRGRRCRRSELPQAPGTAGTLDVRLETALAAEERVHRILESLREQISERPEEGCVRIRQIFDWPREIYRLELELPEISFQRTTLLDRAALEELLADDTVRDAIEAVLGSPASGFEGA